MRINCIPVEYLADQHLLAEWVEILMLRPYIERSMQTQKGLELELIGSNYLLGTGHAKFFYNKLIYVQKRYDAIGVELKRRGYQTNPTLDFSNLPEELFNNWIPDRTAQIINVNRIISRILLKPKWYTYNKQNVDWIIFYSKTLDHDYVYDPSHIGNFGNNENGKKNKARYENKKD